MAHSASGCFCRHFFMSAAAICCPCSRGHLIAGLDAFHLERGFAVAKTDYQIAVGGRWHHVGRRIVSGQGSRACREKESECEMAGKAHGLPQ